MPYVSPDQLERLYEEAASMRDEASHVLRRVKLLRQQSAQLMSMADQLVQSEEDTTNERPEGN